MKLLQVIAHAADGSTVYKFGKKAVSYDWEKSALLADSISQVFYNSQSFWSLKSVCTGHTLQESQLGLKTSMPIVPS